MPLNKFTIGKGGVPVMKCVGCGQSIEFTHLQIKVPVGQGVAAYDKRPVSPVGARIGLYPEFGRRRFPIVKTGPGCLSCALKYPCALPQLRSERRRGL